MNLLSPGDVLDIAQYEKQRAEIRSRIIELKKHRRVPVGELVTLVFENRDTLRFQIQEIMRAERIVTEERIKEEVDTYNELMPGGNELSATLLVEVQERPRLREVLDQFLGIDRGGTTFLVVGDDRVEAAYEGGHSNEARISAVHYLRFKLTPVQAQRFIEGNVPVKIIIDHSRYQEEVELSENVRASLAEDLKEG